jgi:hypothetical protein
MPKELIYIPAAGLLLFTLIAYLLLSRSSRAHEDERKIRVDHRWMSFEEFTRKQNNTK